MAPVTPRFAVGGSPDRVTVVPVIDGMASAASSSRDNQERFKSQLTQFDVARARCAKDEDTQRLLACIVSLLPTCADTTHLC